MIERDVSDECKFKGTGFMAHDIEHRGVKIGEAHFGFPKITHPDYRGEESPEGENTRLIVWRKQAAAVSLMDDEGTTP